MMVLYFIFVTALLGCAAGRLIMPSADQFRALLTRDAFQQPLGPLKQSPFSFAGGGRGPYASGNFTRIPQDDTVCPSYGEAQWAGTVNVADDRQLFYWFTESRGDPSRDPLLLWMNGGPGASSLVGLLTELGPCVLQPGASAPVPNPWSWNNNASVIFLDQPAGTGFSSVAEGGRAPSTDEDGAADFQTFLNVFFRDVFPEKAALPLYIAGESYAGHFTSTYTKHILDARAFNSKDAFWGEIAGLINVNAVLDWTAVSIGVYELLCSEYRGRDFLDPEECDSIRLEMPEVVRLGQECRMGTARYSCLGLMLFFLDHIDPAYRKRIEAGERNNYDVNLPCVNQNGFCEDTKHGNITRYLNQPHIKQAMGVPESMTFELLNSIVGGNYAIEMSKSRAKTLESVLDAPPRTGLDKIRLLVLNGNEDYIVNTPGQKWQYDNLFWSGFADYRISNWRELPDDVKASGFWKGTDDGRLVFVGVDGAGHGVPGYLPEASYRILQRWIANEWR
ncbi:Peptidase S10, serine carboxypeptidase [Cordyceps fumosorosea ARSEF 2679]|uniref:Carboxypeptidase n=1 Tax=Cordyceps fumosorosea (strain ARSEF 2679) TaxID=1081104 RepID=A0A167N6Q4_CORFA|nr:Peptidase S10, serine carboxypeptidase [Cordyceps fumosorosea ARSEF 2679]OAA55196.1 Peptidase S10, serine carboxypeptidase [Cordyceps fumosorosea ARSEF 2679]